MHKDKTIKYFIYARKSSESEDRQVASIESQINELKKIAEKNNLKIIEVLSESQSAKAPGRPVFNEMIRRIYNNEVQGIICWKLDRLARNPIDGGNISWMLQRGIIEHIQSYERDYYPTDNVLIMSVEFGMANQYILDLSQNTKRGLRNKAEKGWYPGPAPTGYLNGISRKPEGKKIIEDPKRFNLVKKMFGLMLTGLYTPPNILKKANNEWNFRTINNKPMALSTIYKMFSEPFYYGSFEYPKKSGNWYQGKHKAAITVLEYDRIQFLLGRKGRPRPKSHTFAFTGLIRCCECGAMITAEKKTKVQKNGNIHNYIYYHCTKRKKSNCSQKCVEQKNLERQIISMLEKIETPHSFSEWALKKLKEENQKETKDRNAILLNQRKSYDDCIKRIDSLIEMRIRNEITQDEFIQKKLNLLKEKSKLQELLNDTDSRISGSLKKAESLFNFAENAVENFKNGDIEKKKEILSALGSNLLLKNRILSISIQKPLVLIEQAAKETKRIRKRLEPLKNGGNELILKEAYSQNTRLLRG